MDFEQILIRLGVDAKAAMSGMTSFKSWAKGWATDLTLELKHHLMGAIGAAGALFGAERVFDAVREKAQFIQRTARETGLATNMIQGMAQDLQNVGEDFESISRPLGKFNVLIGQAKEGIPAARQKLIEWGIATKTENWNTLNATRAIQNLAVQFDSLRDKESQAALLQQVFGKQWQALFPIFEEGAKHVRDLNSSNFFTKMTPQAVEMFALIGKGLSQTKSGGLAVIANLMEASGLGILARLQNAGSNVNLAEFKENNAQKLHRLWERIGYIVTGIKTEEMKHNEELQKKHDLLEENLKVQQLQNEQAKLQNQLTDRNKATVGQLADRAREIMGIRQPRGLKSIHAVTTPMASALRIQNLEDSAAVANAMGNAAMRDSLQSQADRLRLANPFLRSTEQDPTKEIRQHLDLINETLAREGIVVKRIEPQNH